MARSGSSMSCPFRAGVGGDVEMEEAPPLVHQHHEDIENSKGDGRHHEEVRRDQLLRVVVQESPPRLGRRFSLRNHVLGHGDLGDFDTELEQFPMDPRRSPEPIGQTHLADQLPNLPIDRRPSRFALPTLPSPIATEPSSMPGDHRFGLYNQQRRAPLRPEAGEPNPEQSPFRAVYDLSHTGVPVYPDWQVQCFAREPR